MPNQNSNPFTLDRFESHSAQTLLDSGEQLATEESPTSSELAKKPTAARGQLPALVQTATPRMISERKRLANRANAKKSTGPRSARGKAYSSRNALKHGLLAKKGLFAPDGTPIDSELRALWERLRKQSGGDDELLRSVVAEWSHQKRALELEEQSLAKAVDNPASTVSLSKLLRYRAESQRSLLKHLSRFHQSTEEARQGSARSE